MLEVACTFAARIFTHDEGIDEEGTAGRSRLLDLLSGTAMRGMPIGAPGFDNEEGVRENVREELGAWSRLALASQGLVPAPHHLLVIEALEALEAGEHDRLMLLLPPGSAKSTYACQDNWTGTDFLVPQASVVEWEGTWGGWQAVSFPLADYLSPAGDGGVILRSAVGDVVLRPSGNGQVRVSSDTEALGFSTLVGRGSPEGNVVASPGSDFRNLDGGIGSTLWLKRSGSDSTGWSAVA